MSLTNFPHGITSFGQPVIPSAGSHTGNVYWVDSAATLSFDDPTSGSFDVPFKTLDYAIGRCTASNGDVIYVKEGHTETVAGAAGLVFDIAGVTVYFLGEGSNRATITFTATAADMDVTAANVTLICPRFLTGIDAVAAAIHVAAADFHMIGAEYYDAAAKATTIQVLTTSAADRMIIDGYKFIASTTGTQKTDGIKTVAGTGIVLKNIDIRGDFSTGAVDVSTAATNIQLENLYLNNLSTSPTAALVLHANTTGFAKNVKCRVASGTTYISSVAKLSWADDCEGFSTDGYTGEPLGTVLSTGIEGKIDVIDGYFDVPTADATTDVTIRDVVGKKNDAAIYAVGTDKSLVAYLKGILATSSRTAQSATATALTNAATLFTIAGGPIAIEYLVSICIATGDGGAATLQYNSAPTVGSAATISGATGSLATAVAGSMVVFIGTALATAPTFLTTGHGVASTGTSKIVVNAGTITSVVGGSASTATWKHYLRYTPLATGVTVA